MNFKVNRSCESLLFYDFSLPFQDGVMEKVGFAARDDRKNPLVFYEVIAEAPESVQMTEKETYTFLSFDKKAFTNARNWGHVIFGGSQIDEEKESIVFVIFSSTIMIPVTILSISLSIGLFVVFFTSTGKKENV